MARGNYEHAQQVALFQWAAIKEAHIPELACLYAIPNASRRSPRQGAQMKAEGMKAGVPDVALPVQRPIPPDPDGNTQQVGFYAALYIEMKAPDKYPRPEQRAWADRLERWGNKVVRRCITWQDAAREILSYLGHDVTRRKFPELFVD
jgi:hypothetical protein